MLLSSIISCNKNVKTKMQSWSCHWKTLYLQKISCTRQIESKLSLLSFALFLQKNINRRYNYGRHNDKHREQYDTHVWNALRSMSKNIRLGLAVKLTNSVLEEERKEMFDEAYTEEMLNKFLGKWEGNETAEELMGIIKQNS